ncbi:MAG: phosphoribosylformylglycinamidine synthase II [Candidatus Raymondbacteria bacterium RifOxyA12_full_50_37]|nr:MAG: phosphoribosylformylglycinamidine synthase II [Candidatus Raymondbacteria bacterium RifOxyA12_full_50_37]OGJ95770.1 MAG: phosphoribosylformylglycinamidine synthase II [Candidatus Raymondbacteria bacterium RIFOXYC2_FULL_50_21]OGP42683.1 MAG: phosphoribosylformylglycinamidine synthase II [Candidatus Raymondbacteria bacterium RIFOXYB2_FULL_49_35]
MKEPVVSQKLAEEHGLTAEEYQKICQVLGRTPLYTELGIYSVMWSEHCSYKNSIAVLKTFPKEGERCLTVAGEENAGVIDIGEGRAVTFKIESHNHPSAVEPYQGAATGVGGIMRDIFTMGARPIASLNSLRFGELAGKDANRVKYLFSGVVKGIGDYGNCLGVPTVAGEVYFEDSYRGNPLVNAMTVGIMKHEHLASASAKGPGNAVIYVGSTTGRDGIHGASFASLELSEESEEKRSAVQVGDPFTEKLLIEATLEAIQTGRIVGIQDMGAAGLTCSSSEMSAKAGTGMEILLEKVPMRETNMIPYEIMLSESQERMLLVVEPQNMDEIMGIYTKWGLNAVRIGTVTDNGRLRVFFHGERVADIPSKSLVLGGDAPVYIRERRRPAYLDETQRYNLAAVPEPTSLRVPASYSEVLCTLLASPNIASKEWVYEQYDHMVRTNTVTLPGSDAAVLRIKHSRKAIAVSVDCNGRFCYLDPRIGGRIAVSEAARNCVCSGAKPLAITNCLNFGNPYKPEMYWTFGECVEGMSEACRALNTPVTGGNVSFYNENPDGAVYPTPTVGMVGLLNDVDKHQTQWFKKAGDRIVLLGETRDEIGGSEYLKVVHGLVTGTPPDLSLEREKALQMLVYQLIDEGLVNSAHDCAEGGLAVALAECCITNRNCPVGASVAYDCGLRIDRMLFSETQSRVIVSIDEKHLEKVKELAHLFHVPLAGIGTTGGDRLVINGVVDCDIETMTETYFTSIRRIMEEQS